jgi:dTDP-4-amino-4,6-dideoxygalactose transaminase
VKPGEHGNPTAGTDSAVPIVDLTAQYHEIREEIDAAIARVVQRGWFILGQELRAFEEAFARYCGVAHAVGVGSGTEALHLALVALGAGPGKEVVTVANTAVPTLSAISFTGARPVLVDVDRATATMDVEALEKAITSRTAAVVPVDLYGQCADYDPIRSICARKGVPIVADAAQSHGAAYHGTRAGSLAEATAFSFYPSKNLGAYGDAGMVTTDDAALADRLRRLRNYGERERYHHSEVGFNSRLDEMQAAILLAKLPHLDDWNRRRRELAVRYARELSDTSVEWIPQAEGRTHVWHLCVAVVENRDALRARLAQRGIQSQIHYPIPIHLQEAYAFLGGRVGDFPVAESLARRIASLPLYPELTGAAQDRVIEEVRAWLLKPA